MPLTTQEHVLSILEARINDRGDELIIDRDYANTGYLRLLRLGAPTPTRSLEFDFQTSNFHFGPVSDRVAAWFASGSGSVRWCFPTIEGAIERVLQYLYEEDD